MYIFIDFDFCLAKLNIDLNHFLLFLNLSQIYKDTDPYINVVVS